MIPTGGVNLETAADLIRAGSEALGIGGELVSAPALAAGDTKSIIEAARKYVGIVGETRKQISLKTAS
jgi:2-dehydro-3-deoxyphosphogluconate aldolase/(4S)-4-hydroxy-2-oxoglutarate aldolase